MESTILGCYNLCNKNINWRYMQPQDAKNVNKWLVLQMQSLDEHKLYKKYEDGNNKDNVEACASGCKI